MNSAFYLFVLCVTVVVAAPEWREPTKPVCKPACSGGPSDKCLSCPTQCPKTCDDPKGAGKCIQSCKDVGCQCTGDTVRAPNGQCIPLNKCPKKPKCTGGPGDRVVECGSACEPTCKNPKPKACTKQCVPNVCRCDKGLVRNDKGKCVALEKCEKPKPKCTGGPGDNVVECGSACEPTCKNPKPKACTKQCVLNVCRCDKGLVRNDKGKCVALEKCEKPEPKCTGGPHDKVRKCGTSCPATCDKPNPGVCIEVCRVNVCQCDDGYVRGPDGKCILPKECPKKGKPQW